LASRNTLEFHRPPKNHAYGGKGFREFLEKVKKAGLIVN